MSDAPVDSRTILIVEDDSTVAELLVEVLRHEGFNSTVAADGLEGLVRLRGDQPDLAVLDIMMPDINGVRVLEQLLEEGDGNLEVPVIVITGSPEGAKQSRQLLGEENVFEKPFDPDDLVARIRAVLD
ncbi:MAG: response regulator transcription factor [Actinobacteria bacterium]|nr:response regulator transcription factor [Actinomycetota bacterium]